MAPEYLIILTGSYTFAGMVCAKMARRDYQTMTHLTHLDGDLSKAVFLKLGDFHGAV